MQIKVVQTEDDNKHYLLVTDNEPPISLVLAEVDGRYGLELTTFELYKSFSQYKLSDIPSEIDDIWIFGVNGNDFLSLQYIERSGHSWHIGFLLSYSFEEWGRGYSLREFYDELKKLSLVNVEARISVAPYDYYSDQENILDGFYLKVEINSVETIIDDEALRCGERILNFIEEAESSLETKRLHNALIAHFSFPKEVEIACEQYLLYFVEFLRDLGLEATANLQHEAGKVLFAVTPTAKDEALEKIRSAFDVYLQLPANPITAVSEVSEDRIAIQRLTANVHHLNGQLMLAQSILEAKNATIQAHLTTIENQRRLLDGGVIIDSRLDVPKDDKKGDKEDLLDGTLAITKYQGKGFEINLPEIFRRLKKLFKE